MITLTKSGNAIVFTFDDNDHYLNDGTIEVPVNSLTLVTDESQMATFKRSSTNDIFISARYDELGMSKSDLESWFKENACGSTGGGGVTSGDVETMISEATSGLAESSAVTEEISEAVSGKADTSAVTQSINAAVSGKADTSDVQTLSGDVQTLSGDVANKADTTAVTASINAAVSGKMDTSAFNTYSASTDARLAEDEEVTSAALNALDDALDDKADTSAVTASIAAAVSGKQDQLIAGSGITIDSANTISCTVEGGGKAIVAGTNISVTTGETADTVSCTLPIGFSQGYKQIILTGRSNSAQGNGHIVGGTSCQAKANGASYTPDNCLVVGEYLQAFNNTEVAFGKYNKSVQNAAVGGQSGTTIFSIGNGTNNNSRHNTFEIRQNGDIYITSGGTDIKLQDNLGGGGLPESAFTAYTAATEARLAEDEEVTAAALNTLNTATAANTTALGGLKLVQLTQAQYDALTTKDASTLYIITSSN